MRTTASCCQRPCEVLGQPFFWGEAAVELPLKFGSLVVPFLCLQDWSLFCVFICFVLECFAVARVVGGSNLALALSLHWKVVFSCPQCTELPGWGLMWLRGHVGALVLCPWCSGNKREPGTVWAAELCMCSGCFLLCA